MAENNGYGEATPHEFACSVRDIAQRAASYGMPGVIADGMDFLDVYAKAGGAIARARAGEGPTLLECKTYRYFGHYVGDNLQYRSKEEAESWRQGRDPLERFERTTVGEGLVESDALRTIDAEIAEEIEDAVSFAEASPWPSPEDVSSDVYVSY